jgi:BlaI family transcriptional regulator, penicillinase repressor
MARANRETPPPLELMCLSALWTLGEGSVKDVQQAVSVSRPLAYTTIMTVLERLVRKGRVVRRKVSRAYLYVPTASRDAMRQIAVRELLDGFFDGSEADLTAFLAHEWPAAKNAPARPEEVEGEARLDTALL